MQILYDRNNVIPNDTVMKLSDTVTLRQIHINETMMHRLEDRC